jgi:hypothetical protein
MATGSQQPQLPGAVQPAFRRLMAGMRLEAARLLSAGAGPRQAVPGTGGSSTAFTPSRLYPRRRDAGEAAAFWGLAAANLGVLVLGKAGGPDVTAAILTHARVSVESLAAGRLYTLLTCGIAHTSVWHAAANLGMLLLYRHVLPLSAREVRHSEHCVRCPALYADSWLPCYCTVSVACQSWKRDSTLITCCQKHVQR